MAERNYDKEYKNYQGKPEQIKNRASRNAARSKMEQAGKVHKGDGKDVDHGKKGVRNNTNSNLTVKSKSANRSFPRNSKAGKK